MRDEAVPVEDWNVVRNLLPIGLTSARLRCHSLSENDDGGPPSWGPFVA